MCHRFFVDWYLALGFDDIVMLDMSESGIEPTFFGPKVQVFHVPNTKNEAIFRYQSRILLNATHEWVFVMASAPPALNSIQRSLSAPHTQPR